MAVSCGRSPKKVFADLRTKQRVVLCSPAGSVEAVGEGRRFWHSDLFQDAHPALGTRQRDGSWWGPGSGEDATPPLWKISHAAYPDFSLWPSEPILGNAAEHTGSESSDARRLPEVGDFDTSLGERLAHRSPLFHAVMCINRCIASVLASASVTVTYFIVLAMAA